MVEKVKQNASVDKAAAQKEALSSIHKESESLKKEITEGKNNAKAGVKTSVEKKESLSSPREMFSQVKNLYARIKKVNAMQKDGKFIYIDKKGDKVRLSKKETKDGYEISIRKIERDSSWISTTSEYTLKATHPERSDNYKFELITKDSQRRTGKRELKIQELEGVFGKFRSRLKDVERFKEEEYKRNKKNHESEESYKNFIRKGKEDMLANNDQNDVNDILNNIENGNLA